MPFSPNPYFCGRRQILDHIRQRLAPSRNQRRLSLWGLGGSGKSQAALRYCYECGDVYDAVLWVSAANSQTLLLEYANLSNVLKLGNDSTQESACLAVKQWLMKHHKWLLVFDNADDLDEIKLESWFPSADHGSILISSRDSRTTAFCEGIEIGQMDADEAVQFLRQRSHLSSNDDQVEDVMKIAHAVGYLALAIDLAGAYIFLNGITAAQYLEVYKRSKSQLLDFYSGSSEYDKTAYTTWSLSFNLLQTRNSRATDLLRLFAFINRDNIQKGFLNLGAAHRDRFPDACLNYTVEPAESGLSPEEVSLVRDDFEFHAAVQEIMSFSLVQRRLDTQGLSMHPLVQYWVRENLREKQSYWALRAIRLVNHITPRRYFLWYSKDQLLDGTRRGQVDLRHIDACHQHCVQFGQTLSRSDAGFAADLLLRATNQLKGISALEASRAQLYVATAKGLSERAEDQRLFHYVHMTESTLSNHFGDSKNIKLALSNRYLKSLSRHTNPSENTDTPEKPEPIQALEIPLRETALDLCVAQQQEGLAYVSLLTKTERHPEAEKVLSYLEKSLAGYSHSVHNDVLYMIQFEQLRLRIRALTSQGKATQATMSCRALFKRSSEFKNVSLRVQAAIELTTLLMGEMYTQEALSLLTPFFSLFSVDHNALPVNSTGFRELALWSARTLTVTKQFETAELLLHRALRSLDQLVGKITWDFVAVSAQLSELYVAHHHAAPEKRLPFEREGLDYLSEGFNAAKEVWKDNGQLPAMAWACARQLRCMGDGAQAKKVLTFALREGDRHGVKELAEVKSMLDDLSDTDNNLWCEQRGEVEATATATGTADRKKALWRRLIPLKR